ncbi:hypothetical protein [Acidicapsa acidisoli]|uniref:hypothetical protein n=1 Tax=Acidicapsa acidisoli TaxID=1615681 RepID=UPI0021E0C6A1|nr:hypothetical protein [Acidicapsa acidisoli]
MHGVNSSPRQFTWKYQFDPVGKQGRIWTQIGDCDWIELYEAGQHTHFAAIEANANLEGNSGQVVESDGKDISVFIPDTTANGTDPDWLRLMHPGDTEWAPLAQFIAAQPARQFCWNYESDPPGQQGRTWTQIGPSNWVELYESGQQTYFTVMNAAVNVDGNSGLVVENEGKDILVFIPDPFVQGKDPNWLRFMNPDDSQWTYLGKFI